MNLLETVRADYSKFPEAQTYSIYDSDVFFKDPVYEFRGLERYKKMIGFITYWFSELKLELHDIQQEQNGAFFQIHSFPLANKKRYLKCKAVINLLINLNKYLKEKQSFELGNIIHNIKMNKENRIHELNKLMQKNYVGKSNYKLTAENIDTKSATFYFIIKMNDKPNPTIMGLKTWNHYKHNQYIYLFPYGVEAQVGNDFLKAVLGKLITFDETGGNIEPAEFDQVMAKLKPIEVSGVFE
jgi:hypothetical protein